MDRINLIIVKNKEYFDISSLVESINWSGRKGGASRSLKVSIIDDDGYKHARSGIEVLEGHQCIFSYDNVELFRGIIMQQTQNNSKSMAFVAYDNGIYLANNKDSFSYENKTASEIFKDCCNRFSIPYDNVCNTSYVIPELIKSNTTAFDCILEALEQDYLYTRSRHYISSSKDILNLTKRKENIVQWVIESGQSVISYNYSKSIEKTKTRFKVYSNEGAIISESINQSLENNIGVFQDVQVINESKTQTEVTALIDAMKEENGRADISLNVEAIGLSEIISGVGVFIIIEQLGLSKAFYVDEDTHTFVGQVHKMNLRLTNMTDIEVEEPITDYQIGDIVHFKGGYHYNTSNDQTAVGTKCKAGKAKITYMNKGAKHPYHIQHIDSSSRVYGWVDNGTFDKV